jgi:hypothetical protein
MKRTVFVLGAGSSAVYQFPVGERLCQLVCDELGTNSQHGINLRKYTTFKDEEITDFCRQLRMSAQPSVDAFLEYRTEFLDLGKAAMALMLVGHEASDRLWDPRDDNWMRYLFRHLNAPFETFHEIPVSFITFNYDRSLEHFLCTALQSKYGKTEAECAAVLERVQIIHLHGRLGYLPWEKGEGRRSYDAAINGEVLDTCIKNIKVVHEDIKDGRDKDFARAFDLMQKAECIYYLGFGYGPVNMDRLKVRDLAQGKIIYGTGVGLTARECSDIVRLAGDLSKLNPLPGVDCIRLLREYVDWT